MLHRERNQELLLPNMALQKYLINAVQVSSVQKKPLKTKHHTETKDILTQMHFFKHFNA